MEILIVIAIVVVLSYWTFKAGKREGSMRGFAAGRRRERQQRHRRGSADIQGNTRTRGWN